MSVFKPLFLATGMLLLSACTSTNNLASAPSVCSAETALTETTLYFGLSRVKGANISDEEWQQYLNNEVTPRFKEGLTVFDAHGQWLGENGKIVKEPSKALMLIHPNTSEAERNIEILRSHYRNAFDQESVMRVDQAVCVSF